MDETVKELLHEASKLTQAVGRRIVSPKTDATDLLILSAALESIQATLSECNQILTET